MDDSRVEYFYDHLDIDMEKTAFLGALKTSLKSLKGLKNFASTNTGKMMKDIQEGFKSKGLKGAISKARKYKNVETNFAKNPANKINMPESQKIERTIGRGIRSATGNFADNLYHLTKGVSRSKGLAENAKNLSKNLVKLPGRQLRGGRFIEKEFKDYDNLNIVSRNGKRYLKSNSKLLDNKFFDREIIQDTGRGVVVKKRLPMQALSPLTSPGVASVGVGSYGAQSLTEPNKSTSKKIKQSLKDSGRFLLGDAAGMASYLIV